MSRIVGAQSVFNTLFGRYKVIAKETRDYVRGLYGKPPAPIKSEIADITLGNEKPIETRPADFLELMYDKCREEVVSRGYYIKEEDVLTYCLFPKTTIEFFEARKQGKALAKSSIQLDTCKVVKVVINGVEYAVGVEGADLGVIRVSVPPVQLSIRTRYVEFKEESPSMVRGEEAGKLELSDEPVRAPMSGKILQILVKPRDRVRRGDKVVVLESMKTETEIYSPIDGVLSKVLAKEGDTVKSCSVILTIESS